MSVLLIKIMAREKNYKIIVDGRTSHTEWSLVDGTKVVEHAMTQGLNPYFLTRREISHVIRLEVPAAFFKRRWKHVCYYGSGCSSAEKKKLMEASLIAQFKTPTSVYSDLEGTARGLLNHEPGLACILGSGSNSCFYDGEKIVKNVRPLGFILGDEGSGAQLGRLFLGDCLKGFAPQELCEQFFEEYKVTDEAIMDSVYNNPRASSNLNQYAKFLAEHLADDYVRELVTNEMARFFERNILQYDYKSYPVSFAGSVACSFTEVLTELASRYGVTIKKVVRNVMPGLIAYHAEEEE